jgi:hypothetical protein
MSEPFFLFILGILQIIVLGLGAWTLKTLIGMGSQLLILDTRFTEVAMKRIEGLDTESKELREKVGNVSGRLDALEKHHSSCRHYMAAQNNHDRRGQ